MPADFSIVLTFLITLVVVLAILLKAKIFDAFIFNFVLALAISLIFVTFINAREFVIRVVPFFAILLICLVFILAVIGFVGKDISFMTKGFGAAFAIFLAVGMIIAAIISFKPFQNPYASQILEPQWYGAIIILVIAGAASWIFFKVKK